MAASWGLNTLASGASAGWSFSRPYKNGFLPVLSVEPQSGPDQSPGTWTGDGSSYPTFNKLGVSTIWSNQSDASGSKLTNVGMVPGPGQRKLEMELGGEPDKSALLDLHRHFRVDRATSKLVKID
jgi:hypothetical protein